MKKTKKLRHIVPATQEIPVGQDGAFDVRGLNLSDVLSLATEHFPAMTKAYKTAFEKLKTSDDLDAEFFKGILTDTLKEFPAFVPALIATAADEADEEGFDAARSLPFLAQLQAIEAIVSLTLASEGELKKLMEVTANLLGRVNQALLTARSEVSENGLGNYASE